MDLAVGVIIGAAFGKIVDSAVKDLIMPVVGAVIGKIDFSSLYIKLAGLCCVHAGETIQSDEKGAASRTASHS